MPRTKRISRRTAQGATQMPPAGLGSTESRRESRRAGVWQALNEPVVQVSEGFARGILGTALVLLLVAWVGPYWGSAQYSLPEVSYQSPIISAYGGAVAGARTFSSPSWYRVVSVVPNNVANAFASAAEQVLDISGPVNQMVALYSPGFSAVKDAWLELMADPYQL